MTEHFKAWGRMISDKSCVANQHWRDVWRSRCSRWHLLHGSVQRHEGANVLVGLVVLFRPSRSSRRFRLDGHRMVSSACPLS